MFSANVKEERGMKISLIVVSLHCNNSKLLVVITIIITVIKKNRLSLLEELIKVEELQFHYSFSQLKLSSFNWTENTTK